MLTLEQSVNYLTKVGPKYKKLLEKLEIESIEDLLYHFPFRYDDFSNVKPISEIIKGEVVTVKATVDKIDNIYTKNRKKLTIAHISDFSGKTEAIWFNQHWIKSSIKVGEVYQFSGKTDEFNHKVSLISPDYEETNKTNLNTGRLVPIYPETLGVTSKYLRTRINDVLSRISNLEEFLPDILLNKHKITDINDALKKIHFPDNLIEATHARRRFEFEEMFLELLNVEVRKNAWEEKLKGFPLELVNHRVKVKKFIDELPFTLTDSQSQAVEEILTNMSKTHPMNRLLEGDVGTGKTVVAVIASYFAFLNGYKTIYLAPTEILANQHYLTFTKLMKGYGLNISLVTGSKKSKSENFDILIGTHALLFKEEGFGKTGLIVIDEQHRFGVEQRTRLLEMGSGEENKVPHLLTMTATPIPRTLALTLFGDLSISSLKTPPNKDKKITTAVIPESKRQEAYEMIRKRNEPTFIVCPLIEESESTSLENVKAAEAEYILLKEGVLKGMEMGLLHGRMKSKEKQEVIDKFKSGEIKVLVSTPVIEVGIDIPEATIMIIESAERYGLASLHQLRGRVGRGNKPGVCLIFMSNNSRTAYERLKNLEKVSNGLELAEIDMKIRGQGDLYGTMQHGYKQFKVASLENLELLEQAKMEAQAIFPVLNRYPLLKEKINRRNGRLVGNN